MMNAEECNPVYQRVLEGECLWEDDPTFYLSPKDRYLIAWQIMTGHKARAAEILRERLDYYDSIDDEPGAVVWEQIANAFDHIIHLERFTLHN